MGTTVDGTEEVVGIGPQGVAVRPHCTKLGPSGPWPRGDRRGEHREGRPPHGRRWRGQLIELFLDGDLELAASLVRRHREA